MPADVVEVIAEGRNYMAGGGVAGRRVELVGRLTEALAASEARADEAEAEQDELKVANAQLFEHGQKMFVDRERAEAALKRIRDVTRGRTSAKLAGIYLTANAALLNPQPPAQEGKNDA